MTKQIELNRLLQLLEKEQHCNKTDIYFRYRLQSKMQSAEAADKNKASTARLATESNLSTQKKRRSRDITELKVEAENLKVSLSSLTTEREKSQAKERTAYFDDLYQLLETTNVKMDRKVLEHIADLLKLNVHPDNILEFLRTVMARKGEEEEVIFI